MHGVLLVNAARLLYQTDGCWQVLWATWWAYHGPTKCPHASCALSPKLSVSACSAPRSQVNESVSAAQYTADVDFTTRDSTVWDALPNITNPLLVAQGEQDVLVPAANAPLIAARVPGSKLLLVPDWGHAPKGATQLVAAVNEFLDSH